ncbi:MAG: hypothetical protein Q9186_000252 [Xanthomendoza sp. 1 TL-2023]
MPDSKTRDTDGPRTPVSSDKATKTEGINQGRRSNPTQNSQLQESGTWYKGGTWRRGSKATPVTQVAKESIFAATDKASELVTSARNPITQSIIAPRRSPSTQLCRSIESPNRSSSSDTFAKKAFVESTPSKAKDESVRQPSMPNGAPVQDKGSTSRNEDLREKSPPKSHVDSQPPETAKSKEPEAHDPKINPGTPLWRGWFSRYEEPPKPEKDPPKALDATIESTAGQTESPIQRRTSNPELATTAMDQSTVPRSWLGLWPATRSSKVEPTGAAALVSTSSDNRPQSSSALSSPKGSTEPSKPEIRPTSTAKSSGWAFWSRETTKDSEGNTDDRKIGELALAGSPSQSHPESAVLDEAPGVLGKRPRSVESSGKARTPQPQRQKTQKGSSTEPDATSIPKKQIKAEPTRSDSTKHQLLPHITTTSSGVSQVEFLHSPPRIKRALTIGVHGYFPAPLIRSVLGQPTGTSIRFADGAANAIHKWTEAQGYSCEIEKVALEGEGKILERVDMLWKLLLNWTDNIRRADFIMVGCHSQGVPVAIMLIAKLIEFGCIQDARLAASHKLSQRGMLTSKPPPVNLGPFVEYKTRWIGASARELFDFAQSDSLVSKDYNAALEAILKFGVRIAYIGSIDDQLVSLDSSTFGTIDHPNIYRAVFVDGKVHAPDFLTHLVGFALKLRNLGVSDHGLIRELSQPLAGSLYSGEGHSRIYEDDAVYYLAVQNALQATTNGNTAVKKVREDALTSQNPYILPFSLRGVLEEDYVKTELRKETTELLQQFDEWKPSTKILKDVKFRLEGVRSKL